MIVHTRRLFTDGLQTMSELNPLQKHSMNLREREIEIEKKNQQTEEFLMNPLLN